MTYEKALSVLQEYEQTHLLKYYEELSEAEQEELLQQIETLDFRVTGLCKNKEELTKKGKISPLTAMQLEEIEEKKDSFVETGLACIRAGKVGAVLLAGGMGTRLGSDDPKGAYNVGITKELYIFECLIANLLRVVKEANTWIHLFIMTSDKNDARTRAFLKEKNYFGYRSEYITFFRQEMVPATDFTGRVYLEEKGKIATSPNGNGGWFSSMNKCGVLQKVYDAGIEWINVFAVDNVLQRIADPCFIGATIQSGYAVGSKVVKKATPEERVGVMCLEDGRPSIVEYYELTKELLETKDEKGEPAYNFGVILNYLFQVRDLEHMMNQKMPLHIVEKKIPYLNEAGEQMQPEKPNGYKFETLALDMIHLSKDCLPFEVDRRKEFAPIKNKTGVDSVDTARELLIENGVSL